MLSIFKIHVSIALLLWLAITGPEISGQTSSVKIVNENKSWKLEFNGHPFYVKGVVGDEYLDKVKEYGGNSIRIGYNRKELDKAWSLGLNALVNLPANAERYGMDYNDTLAIRKQTEEIISIVKKIKDHPAVLMWAIGNELDYVPPLQPFNPRVWDAVNQAAKAIHLIDPNHPVMTVIGTSMMGKVANIVKRCPDLDLLGINTYGDIYTLPETLEKYGWTKPYLISEWGPDGYWEVRKTTWGAPYEQTGLEKYICYEKKYKEAISSQKEQCLGSYVFYWNGFKQETTHTWFCMFDSTGLESPLVGLMHYMWTGKKPKNSAPVVDSLNIASFVRYQQIVVDRGSVQPARVTVHDPDNDKLTYKWEIRPEAKYASYAGQGEVVPQPLPDLVKGESDQISFNPPSEPGAYRLFVYVYDGKGHFSTGNLPFYVR
jgi:hypothetical protein